MKVDFNNFRERLTYNMNKLGMAIEHLQKHGVESVLVEQRTGHSFNEVAKMVNLLNCMESEADDFDCMPDIVEVKKI